MYYSALFWFYPYLGQNVKYLFPLVILNSTAYVSNDFM